jgi:hypothetical protein
MTRIDWPAQLETCQLKIARLKEAIASHRRKLQRLSLNQMESTYAQRSLSLRVRSLKRVQGYKELIETRISDGVAGRHRAVPFS